MFGLGQKKRQHGMLLLTEDSRCLNLGLPVREPGAVRDDKAQQAWALLPDCCFPQYGSNTPYMLVSEREQAPIPLEADAKSSSEDSSKMADKIFIERRKQATHLSESEARREKFADLLQTFIYGGGAMLLAILVLGLIESGRARLPF